MRAWLAVTLTAAILASGHAGAQPTAVPLRAPGGSDAAAMTAVAWLPRATAVNDADGDKVFDDLARAYAQAPAGARLPVIVSFAEPTTTAQGLALVRREVPDAPVDIAFDLIPAYAGGLSLAEALRLARLAQVRQIELDHPAQHELATARLHMGVDAAVDAMGVTGDLDGDPLTWTTRDVGIAILDSGIDARHVDLANGKLVAWRDFGGGSREPVDTEGHGTHVASIAAGAGVADPEHRGVAPGASLIGVRVVGSASNGIGAYEWVVKNRHTYNIRVATMSLGFGNATDGTTAIERAVDRTWQSGIVTLKSVGNRGPEKETLTVPSAARGVLAIGALLDPGGAKPNPGATEAEERRAGEEWGFTLARFSSRGPTTDGRTKPDLMAPGVAIKAAQHGTERGLIEKSGTSMAAPFAAGVAALVIAAHPELSPDEVRGILFETAQDWGPTGPDDDYGVGRIQAREAVREALKRAGKVVPPSPPPPEPYHEVRAGTVGIGPYESTFLVNDTSNPVAATFLSDGKLILTEIRTPEDGLLGRFAFPLPDRQQQIGFIPTGTGTYTFRIVAAPGTSFTLDLSHGVVPPLVDTNLSELEEIVAGLPPPAQTPGAGTVALLVAVGALALALRKRRT